MLDPLWEFFVKDYDEGLSLAEIALKYNTYANHVKRTLLEAGATLRTKSDAQKNFLKKNPDKHPKKSKNSNNN